MRHRGWILLVILNFLPSFLFAQDEPPATAPSPAVPVPNIFAEQFYLVPNERLRHRTEEIGDLLFVKAPGRDQTSRYAVVTDFSGKVLRTWHVPGVVDDAGVRKWIEARLKTEDFEGVAIRHLSMPAEEGGQRVFYWVGHRGFPSVQNAQAQIALAKAIAEAQGGDFSQMVRDARTAAMLPEAQPPIEIKSPAQQKREEELMLKYLDQLDIGEKLWGPFHGEPVGEPIIWQSFGDIVYRNTNLDSRNFNSVTGFWTNRLVFKGIRAPLNTIDPYLEIVPALEGVGRDSASTVKLYAGLEWRPFAQNPWLLNFRPWNGVAVLEWIRNYRLYLQYGNLKNLKGEIETTHHDLIWGFDIFYEWGVEMPPLDQPPPVTFSDYVEQYVWGEYFGNYRFEMTNFGSEDDFDAFLWNSDIILGVKLPGIPLPENPITNEIVLMPYVRFEHINNTEFSFHFQNRLLIAAGVRWMPFRNWRWKENEWLSKTKIFGEFVGIGLVQHAKNEVEVPNAIRYDLRFGLKFSQRRF